MNNKILYGAQNASNLHYVIKALKNRKLYEEQRPLCGQIQMQWLRSGLVK